MAKTKSKNQVQQTWNRITGTMKVYGNTFDKKGGKKGETITKWSVSVSGKEKGSDDYVNYYLPVYFRGKDSEEPESDGLHTIEVSNAFLSLDVYTNKDDEEVRTLVLVITENEVSE